MGIAALRGAPGLLRQNIHGRMRFGLGWPGTSEVSPPMDAQGRIDVERSRHNGSVWRKQDDEAVRPSAPGECSGSLDSVENRQIKCRAGFDSAVTTASQRIKSKYSP